MPPTLLFDISGIDLNHVIHDAAAIREENAQRGSFQQLQAVVFADPETKTFVGYKDVGHDEFWVKDHVPGRPLFPGVLMLELGAQLASYYTRKYAGWTGFLGFGGADNVRFRGQVLPGQRLYVLGKQKSLRHRMMVCEIQGLVEGNMVFEATIIGVQL